MFENRAARLVWAFLTLSLLLGFVILTNQPKVCSEDYRKDIIVHAGSKNISAQTAKSEADREKGLSGRNCIGPTQGMLFIFDKPAGYSFWMKDMKFNLDIIWIGADKKIVYEKTDVSPATYPQSFSNPIAAQYVLEVAAGQAGKLGLTAGKQLYY